jgi:two-component system response regulator HydG
MTTKGRILVVDDDAFMVKTLCDILRISGWEVERAGSGYEAVAASSRVDFDVILMDVRMRGMDGVEAFKAMKAQRPDAKVFLMTAYAANDLLAEAEREGVMRVLPKPVNVHALLDLLAQSTLPPRPVLLVDTDRAFLQTLSDVLVLRGFPTVTAGSLEDAMRLLAEEQPRAILLHLHLGRIQPEAAIAAMHDAQPATSLILYSGKPHGDDDIPRDLPREWIHTYLQKPFAVDRVTGVLDAIGAR